MLTLPPKRAKTFSGGVILLVVTANLIVANRFRPEGFDLILVVIASIAGLYLIYKAVRSKAE